MIINDDSFNFITNIENGSIDLIVIDPPYNISKKSYFKNGDLKKYASISIDFGYWDKDLDFDFLFSEFYRILRKGGTLITFYDIWKASELKELSIKYKFKQPRICTWEKTNPVPINSKINYLSNSSEYFFSFTKDKNPTFNSKYDKGVYNYPICHGTERLDHPTQKPLSLIKDIILKHSNENDIVLDIFSGSGTTAEACILTNRKFICVEMDEKYYEMSINRIKHLQLNKI